MNFTFGETCVRVSLVSPVCTAGDSSWSEREAWGRKFSEFEGGLWKKCVHVNTFKVNTWGYFPTNSNRKSVHFWNIPLARGTLSTEGNANVRPPQKGICKDANTYKLKVRSHFEIVNNWVFSECNLAQELAQGQNTHKGLFLQQFPH